MSVQTHLKQGESELPPDFASRAVRVLRKLLGLTQNELAIQIKRTATTVVRYETSRPPTGNILLALCGIASFGGYYALSKLFELAWTIERRASQGEPTWKFPSVLTLSDGRRSTAVEILSLYEKAVAAPADRPLPLPDTKGSALWEPGDRQAYGSMLKPEELRAHAVEIQDTRAAYIEALMRLLEAEDSKLTRWAIRVITAALQPWFYLAPKSGAVKNEGKGKK
jgi:transcriptional regulator with XRE-family HTH domain